MQVIGNLAEFIAKKQSCNLNAASAANIGSQEMTLERARQHDLSSRCHDCVCQIVFIDGPPTQPAQPAVWNGLAENSKCRRENRVVRFSKRVSYIQR